MNEEEQRSQELADALAAHIAKGIVEGFLDAERAKIAKQYEWRILELEAHNAALERAATAMQEYVEMLEEQKSVQESQMVTLRNSVDQWRDKYDATKRELDNANEKVAAVTGWQLGDTVLRDLEWYKNEIRRVSDNALACGKENNGLKRLLEEAEVVRDKAIRDVQWLSGQLDEARERIINLNKRERYNEYN